MRAAFWHGQRAGPAALCLSAAALATAVPPAYAGLHIPPAEFVSYVDANKQERRNCEPAGHFRYARGINKESLIFPIATFHHHSIKPRGSIGGQTPAEAAGIGIQGYRHMADAHPERRGRHMTHPKHSIPYHTIPRCYLLPPAPIPCG